MLRTYLIGGRLIVAPRGAFPGGGNSWTVSPGVHTSAWRRIRVAHLQAYPYCEDCLPTQAMATQVHHIHKRTEGGPLLTPHLMSLCAHHHSQRTRNGE